MNIAERPKDDADTVIAAVQKRMAAHMKPEHVSDRAMVVYMAGAFADAIRAENVDFLKWVMEQK